MSFRPLRINRWSSRLCVCFCIIFFDQPALSQSGRATDPLVISYNRLLGLNKRVATLTDDLMQVAKALGTRDREITREVIDNAQRVTFHLFHAMDVLWLYQNMTSAKDRKNVREQVQGILKELVKYLEADLKATNEAMADITKPGIANSAADLRNAIRESIETLNAVQL